jgi:hypothetical protein
MHNAPDSIFPDLATLPSQPTEKCLQYIVIDSPMYPAHSLDKLNNHLAWMLLSDEHAKLWLCTEQRYFSDRTNQCEAPDDIALPLRAAACLQHQKYIHSHTWSMTPWCAIPFSYRLMPTCLGISITSTCSREQRFRKQPVILPSQAASSSVLTRLSSTRSTKDICRTPEHAA